jgi:hypothetical protein
MKFDKVVNILLESDVFHDNFEYISSFNYSKVIVEVEEPVLHYEELNVINGKGDFDFKYVGQIDRDKLQGRLSDGQWVKKFVMRGSIYNPKSTNIKKLNIGNGEYIGTHNFKPEAVYIVKKPEYLKGTYMDNTFVEVFLKVNMADVPDETKEVFSDLYNEL